MTKPTATPDATVTDAAMDAAADHPAMSKWSADLVRTLGNVWRMIQRRNPDVPDVVITIASGTNRKGLTLGHFATNAWQNGKGKVHELMVGAEGLSRGAEDILTTLLHEAAHGVCTGRIEAAEKAGDTNARKAMNDCSRQGRWHNANFRANALEIGLTYPEGTGDNGKPLRPPAYEQLGWSAATLSDESRERYARQIAEIEKILIAYRRSLWTILAGTGDTAQGTKGDGEEGESGDAPKAPKTYLAAICGCEKPRRIQKIARVVFEIASIHCGECGEDFREDA